MLNYLWAFMIIVGILWGVFHGTVDLVTQGALDSAKEAVSLCITMLGVMSFWTGVLEIGQSAGLIQQLAGKMRPVLKFLFPHLPEDHPAGKAIATNMIANILGLGWAATPAGLKAMESLDELDKERRRDESKSAMERNGRAAWEPQAAGSDWNGRKNKKGGGPEIKRPEKPVVPKGVASNEMCTFLILNISSLQLIPVNMIAYRSQYGAVNPAAIVGPAIAATAVSTLVAVVFCKVMDGKQTIFHKIE